MLGAPHQRSSRPRSGPARAAGLEREPSRSRAPARTARTAIHDASRPQPFIRIDLPPHYLRRGPRPADQCGRAGGFRHGENLDHRSDRARGSGRAWRSRPTESRAPSTASSPPPARSRGRSHHEHAPDEPETASEMPSKRAKNATTDCSKSTPSSPNRGSPQRAASRTPRPTRPLPPGLLHVGPRC